MLHPRVQRLSSKPNGRYSRTYKISKYSEGHHRSSKKNGGLRTRFDQVATEGQYRAQKVKSCIKNHSAIKYFLFKGI